MTAPITPLPDRPRRRLTTGLIVSLVAHACLVAVLIVIPCRMWQARMAERAQAAQAAQAQGGSGQSDKAPAEKQAPPQPSPEVAEKAERIMTDKVDTELSSAIETAAGLPDDEKLSRLGQLGRKLDKVSSDKSVTELSQKFQTWLKTTERAAAPAEQPAAGEFDYGTAQFHDVVRQELPEGGYVYKSVLLDSAGRTVEVELDPAEGERTYSALSIVKGNPLLDKVYRQITMPLLDKLIKAADQAANQVESAPVPEGEKRDPAPKEEGD